MMHRQNLLFAVLVLIVSLTFHTYAEDASGIVYNDKNGNAALDSGERGIPDVLVSNGVDVVKTDRAGRYAIPVTDETIVFVIKPRGWMTPVGPNSNVHRFYYIHKPNGSPKMEYAGVAPTGPLPKSIDFPLHRQKEPNKFKVLCFGDTQTRNVEETNYLAHDILEEVDGADVAFGITLGDNVFNDLTVFEPLVTTMSSTGIPWRYVPGNHDHNHDAPTAASTDDSFERVFGPAYYSFNYGPVHFIVFDDIRVEVGKEDYHGGLGEQQLAFIKNDLAHVNPSQLVVLLMHIPVHRLEDSAALYDLLKSFPHTFSLSAHTHTQENVFIQQGWPQKAPHHHLIHGTACGAWWGGAFDETGVPSSQMSDGTPNGYSYITFDGARYSVDYRVAGATPEYQMNIWIPDHVKASETAQTPVVTNVFAGSARSTVEMRLDKAGKWAPMEAIQAKDPFFVQTNERQQQFLTKIAALNGVKEPDDQFMRKVRQEFAPVLRGLPKPNDVRHLWSANLPNLTPGSHMLEIRTTDMYGHTYTAKRIFIVD